MQNISITTFFTDTISHLESLNMKLISTFSHCNYFQCKKIQPNGQFFTVAQIPLFIFAVHSQFEFCNRQIIFSRTNWKTNLKWISLPKKVLGNHVCTAFQSLHQRIFTMGPTCLWIQIFQFAFAIFLQTGSNCNQYATLDSGIDVAPGITVAPPLKMQKKK